MAGPVSPTVDAPVEAPPRVSEEVERQLEAHRRELTGYCYRMLGSAFDADDAVQEVMVRAWRGIDRFDGRASLRTWLYRIATNVCFDVTGATRRRAMPMDLSPGASPPVASSLGAPLPERTWVGPAADDRIMPETSDPAELAVARESVRLAFVVALQHLPARQRAVLILREVLRWRADEVADLLGTTVASVNSALQRARVTIAGTRLADAGAAPDPLDDEHAALLARYVEAFEAYDIEALVALLHEDATQSMPPWALWISGPVDIGRWHLGPGAGCRGSRLVAVSANGSPAFAQYKPGGTPGRWDPWAVHLLEIRDGRISSITNFVGPDHFRVFGLPLHLDA
ncbi:sigma-70 family RNA polymerase sigma factor [Cellulomonas sp. ATA003]|uniref:sigma-70 family RNA polymerase sigma factor n=1 Tax=Cellulomonas sp. ATA003 TaxID=3073064 RepID=UPI002872E36D|nr:sigma-70 family RNA polymerase sigma factor [Cellulomonas sp. ATA003]WNB84388.1 sigma-70 family RNA polymerase sigma factor [Cellulomonas sp. ATA003]